MTKISAFTKKHSATDQRLILLSFRRCTAENCVARRFQRLHTIDLSKDAHDSLVVHFRRLEDHMDDPLVGEDNIIDERRLEGTLRATDGLRAGWECISWICLVSGAFCASRRDRECGWVWHRGGAMRRMVSAGIE